MGRFGCDRSSYRIYRENQPSSIAALGNESAMDRKGEQCSFPEASLKKTNLFLHWLHFDYYIQKSDIFMNKQLLCRNTVILQNFAYFYSRSRMTTKQWKTLSFVRWTWQNSSSRSTSSTSPSWSSLWFLVCARSASIIVRPSSDMIAFSLSHNDDVLSHCDANRVDGHTALRGQKGGTHESHS